MLSIRQQVAKVTKMFRNCGPNEGLSMVWQAIIDLHNEHPWAFILKEGKLITEPQYNTGTVGVTNNSTAVTLSVDGTWGTSWTTSPSSRRIVIAGRSEDYGLTITGANTGTLDSVWLGDTNATANYFMFRPLYSLPSDCDYAREYIILDPARNGSIKLVDFGTFWKDFAKQQNAPGLVKWATRGPLVSVAGVAIAQLYLGPNPPSSQEVYPIWYFMKPTKPTTLDDFPTPLWPERAEDLIYRRARWQYAEDHNLAMVNRLKDVYLERYFDVASEFDGKNEMERRIRSTYPSLPFEEYTLYSTWFQGTYPSLTYPS